MSRLWRNYWIEASLFIVGCVFIHFFLWDRNLQPHFGSHLNTTKASELGQFIGGYLGTIFLLASVALLIGLFRTQRATSELASFENRFFELLKYHRENVSEIGIGDRMGRKVFVSLIREFRETLDLVQACCEHVKVNYSQQRKTDLAYTAFYYGVGPNSSRLLRSALDEGHPPELIASVIATMEGIQTTYRQGAANLGALTGHPALANQQRGKLSSLTRLSYCPFDGHQSRLGHYYRHMYQLVKYAAWHTPKQTSPIVFDLLRAQLTNHEQALLCLNALSKMGSAWRGKGYLEHYGLIKNLPKNFFDPDTELNVPAIFPQIRLEYDSTNSDEPNREGS